MANGESQNTISRMVRRYANFGPNVNEKANVWRIYSKTQIVSK
jgi:hypothetical protein